MIIYVRDNVVSLEKLVSITRNIQTSGKTVALCHGCFDILHVGHLRHFEAAQRMADVLVVTVTPDRYVNKGPNRPIFPEEQRVELVAGLKPVNWVATNEWGSAVETILRIKPDIYVKGQEYESSAARVNPNFFEEERVVEEVGGKVKFTYEFTSSSTSAVERLWNVTK